VLQAAQNAGLGGISAHPFPPFHGVKFITSLLFARG